MKRSSRIELVSIKGKENPREGEREEPLVGFEGFDLLLDLLFDPEEGVRWFDLPLTDLVLERATEAEGGRGRAT